MKSAAAAAAVAWAATLQVANANFDLYSYGTGGNGISANVWGYQVYDSDVDCDHAIDWLWKQSDDVSGGYGVRCEGGGCAKTGVDDVEDVELYEMRFNSGDLHWTAYRDRDWILVDTDDNQVGTCMPYPGDAKTCGLSVGQASMGRVLRCLINSVDSEDIYSHRP